MKKKPIVTRIGTTFVPEEARWTVLSTAAENIGEKTDHVWRIIEREILT